jgi:hypothetical protein
LNRVVLKVVLRPATSISPGHLVEMEIVGPSVRPTELET